TIRRCSLIGEGLEASGACPSPTWSSTKLDLETGSGLQVDSRAEARTVRRQKCFRGVPSFLARQSGPVFAQLDGFQLQCDNESSDECSRSASSCHLSDSYWKERRVAKAGMSSSTGVDALLWRHVGDRRYGFAQRLSR